jgi:hypothetical protein
MLKRRAAAVLAPLVALGGVGLLAGAGGSPPARVDLRAGGAWVASSTVGLMTLIDGSSAQVVARVDIGDGSPGLTAVQVGPVGYAVDGTRGTVVRVDPRTFAPGPPTEVVTGTSPRVVARATERAVYVLDEGRGRVAVADPDDLAVRQGDEVSVADGVRSSVLDRDGRLWLLGETTGDLVWFDGPERHTRRAVVDDPARAELVVAGGSPVVVDRATRTVRRIGADGGETGRACIDMRDDDRSVQFGAAAGGDRVYAVSGDQGVLRVSDLATGRCANVAVTVAGAGADLGPPVEAGGRVFVPDYTTGKVAVVDVDRDRMVVTDRPVAQGRFELFVEDGFVFYNDPDSERAGVIHVDGEVDGVLKYDPANPGEGLDNELAAAPVAPPESLVPDDARPGTTVAGQDPDDPAGSADPGSRSSPDDTRPARPDEVAPPGGAPGSTTTTSPGSTGSTGTTPSSTSGSTTTSSSSTTLDTTPTTSCPGPDSDRDGIPDSCDFDDDGDTVTDDLDVCPGFDDRADQDRDGNPDGCDNTDGSPPIVQIVDVSNELLDGQRTLSVTVHAEDPQTGVARIEVSLTYERVIKCTGPIETVTVGPLVRGADGVTDFTAAYRLPTCRGGPGTAILDIAIEATARNPDGVSASTTG